MSPDAKPLGEPTLEGVGNRPQQLMYIGALLSPAHGRNNNKPEGQTAKHDHRRSVFTLLGLAARHFHTAGVSREAFRFHGEL